MPPPGSEGLQAPQTVGRDRPQPFQKKIDESPRSHRNLCGPFSGSCEAHVELSYGLQFIVQGPGGVPLYSGTVFGRVKFFENLSAQKFYFWHDDSAVLSRVMALDPGKTRTDYGHIQ